MRGGLFGQILNREATMEYQKSEAYRLAAANQPLLEEQDFGGEVFHAFDCLPINRKLNDEIMSRAIERRRIRLARS
jgi:hypothetical protein